MTKHERLNDDFRFKVANKTGHRLAGWSSYIKCKMVRPEIMSFGYCWDDENVAKGINTEKYRGWVRESLRQWEACGGMKFTEEAKCRRGPDFVTIHVGSYHPMVVPDVDVNTCKINGFDMYLSFYTFGNVVASTLKWTEKQHKAEIQQYALHEFGHFLGFDHEQNRKDTKCEQYKPDDASKGTYDITKEYDLDSIMNYCRPNGHYKPWLSEQDKRAVWSTYRGRDWAACDAATKHWQWQKGELGEGYDLTVKQLQQEEQYGLNACVDLLDSGECSKATCDAVMKSYYCRKTCRDC
jgi:hypothetical protein